MERGQTSGYGKGIDWWNKGIHSWNKGRTLDKKGKHWCEGNISTKVKKWNTRGGT